MRNTLSVLALAAIAVIAAWGVSQVRIVYVERFCSGPKRWRVTVGPPDATNLRVTSGVYRASSYSLTNGFGLRPPGVSVVAVPFGTNALRATNRFER
jgi:hypothetical protein